MDVHHHPHVEGKNFKEYFIRALSNTIKREIELLLKENNAIEKLTRANYKV